MSRPGPLRSLFDINPGVRLIARRYVINNWLLHPLVVAGLMLLVGGSFLLIGALNDIAKKDAFMTECLTERKEYECIAMWRSGNTAVIPVFLPSGGG